MTAHKSMNQIIHAAFRRDLRRFDEALGGFPDGSRERADQLSAAWENFEHQLHHHHQDEETIFFPTLGGLGADASLVGELQGEHADLVAALEAASTSMTSFAAEPSAANARAARLAVADLHASFDAHVTHEERDLEPFAATQLSTPEWKTAQTAVRKAHKGETGTFFAWLMDGTDADTAAALRQEVPAPVLFILGRVGGGGYRRRIASVWD
jgi:hemerythrin-like domain-containing protein